MVAFELIEEINTSHVFDILYYNIRKNTESSGDGRKHWSNIVTEYNKDMGGVDLNQLSLVHTVVLLQSVP